MDAQLSNNLSRGLSAVAGTLGQYAMAEHEERVQAAKEQFEQMLSDKKEAAEDNRASADEAQKAKDHAAETELAREQHAQDKAQQQSQFDISKSQQDRQFAETRAQEAQRLAIEQQTADRAAKNENGDKPLTNEQKLDHLDKLADGWTKQADRENAKLTKLQSDPMYQAGDPNAIKAVQAQQQIVSAAQANANSYNEARDKASRDAGIALPAQTTSPATPVSNGGFQIVKDAKGNFYKTSSSGSPTPLTPQQAHDLYNQSKSGAGTPGSSSPSAPSPSASAPASSDDSSDDSASTTPDASSTAPAATAGAYAQSQPQPQPAVPQDPSPATAPVGQPDPNNPTLAS